MTKLKKFPPTNFEMEVCSTDHALREGKPDEPEASSNKSAEYLGSFSWTCTLKTTLDAF